MSERAPYTMDELAALLPQIQERIQRVEELHPEARGLPALSVDEATELIFRMIEHAREYLLTGPECFLFGQLINQLVQAARAEVLTGTTGGHYYVFREEDINRILRSSPQ